MLVRFPPFITEIPANELSRKPLKSHSISIGRSPDGIKQVTDTDSSIFTGSSPKSK